MSDPGPGLLPHKVLVALCVKDLGIPSELQIRVLEGVLRRAFRWIFAAPQAACLGRIQDHLDPPPQSRCGFRQLPPNRLQGGQNRLGVHLINRDEL